MKPVRKKLIKNGGSQAVRLPKECRFPAQDEVLVSRDGRRVIPEPADEWPAEFRKCLGAWQEDIRRPKQRRIGTTRNPL